MASAYTTSPLAGVNIDLKTTDPLVKVGTVVPITSSTVPALNGKFAIYVRAVGVIGNSLYATVDFTGSSGSITASSTFSVGNGTAYCRNGSVAFADGEYGWLYVIRSNPLFRT